MKVSYARLVNLGNYENERLELTDDVHPDETAEQAYARVRAWVFTQINERDAVAQTREQAEEVADRLRQTERKLSRVMQRWDMAVIRFNQLRDVLAQHGVHIEPLDPALHPITVMTEELGEDDL